MPLAGSVPAGVQPSMSRKVRYAALGLVVLLGLVVVVLLVWLAPPALYKDVGIEPAREGAEASTRTGLIAGLAGLAALVGLAFTARTYRLAEQGHLTDRYTGPSSNLARTSSMCA